MNGENEMDMNLLLKIITGIALLWWLVMTTLIYLKK